MVFPAGRLIWESTVLQANNDAGLRDTLDDALVRIRDERTSHYGDATYGCKRKIIKSLLLLSNTGYSLQFFGGCMCNGQLTGRGEPGSHSGKPSAGGPGGGSSRVT